MLLEVCVDNIESALNACRGGAKRLELCSMLSQGGLTPSYGLFKVTRQLIPSDCAIFVMIRPNPDVSFCYDSHEIKIMLEDIKMFKQGGVDGFVFGCLNKNKQIDKPNCLALLEAAKGFPCTFHRAFDITENPEDALLTLINLGFSRLLTSGQEENAFLGKSVIRRLVQKVKDLGSSLIVVAGGGITPDNLQDILKATGVKEYHGSARAKLELKEHPSGTYTADQSIVKEMIKIGHTLNSSVLS